MMHGRKRLGSGSSWLVVEGNEGKAPKRLVPAHQEPDFGADSVLSVGMDSITSSSSSFTSPLNSSSINSRSRIAGSSFCRLGASLLKQSLPKEKDPLKPLTTTQNNRKTPILPSTMLAELAEPCHPDRTNDPPFQKSEAYRHYQRSISSSESDSDTETKSTQNTDKQEQWKQVRVYMVNHKEDCL